MKKQRFLPFFSSILLLLLIINGSVVILSESNEPLLTKTIYSDAADGFSKYLGTSMVHSWEEVRNNNTGNQAHDDWNNYLKGILAAYNSKNGDLYVISRSYFMFDTHSIPESSLINNVSLFLYGCGTNESRVCVVEWHGGADGVGFDDYSQIGETCLGLSKEWIIDGYNEIPLNNNGINAINTSGLTYLACREYDHDFLDVPPTGDMLAEYRNGHYFSEEPGTEKDPYLLITYQNMENDDNAAPSTTPSIPIGGILLCILVTMMLLKKRKREF